MCLALCENINEKQRSRSSYFFFLCRFTSYGRRTRWYPPFIVGVHQLKNDHNRHLFQWFLSQQHDPWSDYESFRLHWRFFRWRTGCTYRIRLSLLTYILIHLGYTPILAYPQKKPKHSIIHPWCRTCFNRFCLRNRFQTMVKRRIR